MLIVNENSYMSIEEADELVRDYFVSTSAEYITWFGLQVGEKESIIISSTYLLENEMYIGRQYSDQDMQFPRLINGDKVEVPKRLKLAILTQGITSVIENKDYENKLSNMGVEEYKTDGASIKFSSSRGVYYKVNGVYKSVKSMISKFIY